MSKTEKLFILKKDGSNWLKWLEAVDNEVQHEYGDISSFITTGVIVVRDLPNKVALCQKFGVDQTSAAGGRMLENGITLYQKQEASDKKSLVNIFGLLKQWISPDGLAMVKKDALWAETNLEKDPNKLMKLLKRTHNSNVCDLPKAEAAYFAEERYMNLEQGKLSLMEFRDHEALAIDNMESLGCTKPSDNARARRFLMKLNMTRHGDFVREVTNDSRKTIPIPIPETIQKVIDAASFH